MRIDRLGGQVSLAEIELVPKPDAVITGQIDVSEVAMRAEAAMVVVVVEEGITALPVSLGPGRPAIDERIAPHQRPVLGDERSGWPDTVSRAIFE